MPHSSSSNGAGGIRRPLAGSFKESITTLSRARKSGTTFRKLPDADKTNIDRAKAIDLMLTHPSTIKRPVVEYPDGYLVGFKPDEWNATFPA